YQAALHLNKYLILFVTQTYNLRPNQTRYQAALHLNKYLTLFATQTYNLRPNRTTLPCYATPQFSTAI
ncbi:MAG: hypothetical protein J1F61_06335, partial [Clostridiales bacterium]|nr:hypothetical protein [Clostridiales bacterium]